MRSNGIKYWLLALSVVALGFFPALPDAAGNAAKSEYMKAETAYKKLRHSPRKQKYRENWIACIKSRKQPVADVEIGHRSTTVCHLGNMARWLGRRVKWDPVKEIFPGDDEANSYLERPMRKPYRLPETI